MTRMDKKTTTLLFGLVLLVLGLGLGIALTGRGDSPDVCRGKKTQVFTVVIRNANPSHAAIDAKLCDKITFTSNDAATREIGFGDHDNHVPYDGISERILNKGDSLSITLNQTGTYHWHDHLHDEVTGYFTVTMQ